MNKLFWKFFLVIWLTLTASVMLLFLLTKTLQLAPLPREIAHQKELFALHTATALLHENGLDAAQTFINAADQVPTSLVMQIIPLEGETHCPTHIVNYTATTLSKDLCYQITVEPEIEDPLSVAWMRFAPITFVLMAAALAAFWLTRYLVTPIFKIRMGLKRLAGGHFDTRIAHTLGRRNDELVSLAHDFDISAEHLEKFQKSRERLFHDVSHELRSPLSRLQAAIGVLQQNPAKLEAMVPRMEAEVERMDGLIGEILTLARLTSRSKEEFELQTLDIIDLLNDIVADAAFEAQARNIILETQGEDSFIAKVNGELIYRALENVIRNAVKYSPDDTIVTIRSLAANGWLDIEISDQGAGVNREELSKIFQPFSRGEGNSNGFGLGLAITRQAIEKNGGRIAATLPDNGGLSVTISIPNEHSARD
ncbi:HAMP domain-containing sensor histidine kinase [uncultured Cohaesibacter sp.]|uniref:HAMP domain-containing sensor histidine kinase n=1 Tax=uncultured Cohaesibacter sp. TaxID=1002546 RepID=UPI0029312E04|nr:HAMP domain-containing sensor histidine kinase [uncultured Cohaesibacter sp.]